MSARKPRPKRKFETLPDTAAEFGSGRRFIKDLLARGELEAIDVSRPGAKRRRLLISRESIDNYVASKTIVPDDEPVAPRRSRRRRGGGVKEFV